VLVEDVEVDRAGRVKVKASGLADQDFLDEVDADAEAQRDRLRPWVRLGQVTGEVRADLPAARIVSWLMLLMDGFLERVAVEPGFTASGEKELLVATAREFLRPR
jgi:hypothetical protein